ncbi:MAG: DHH family phosphoesterase [Cellvibrionales bacterium]|nr:DHH family phosphoesterase [Cellvibrionales bacterium]
MTAYDIFNGDADGICALLQLRQAAPRTSRLITGVKRDIALIERQDYAAGDQLCVLDISLDKNRTGLQRALAAGAEVLYFDHHFAGQIPYSPRLETHIDTGGDICTSLLVDRYLGGRGRAWAVVGTFGDNLHRVARRLAQPLQLNAAQLAQLQNLGTYINYNSYGAKVADLHFAPAALYRKLLPHTDPLAFIAEDADSFARIEQGYRQDLAQAATVEADYCSASLAVFRLPDAAWARRVSGVYGNQLARATPERAHLVLTEKPDGSYLVSARAPLDRKTGADEICRQFPTGGGRQAAAGIDSLPAERLGELIQKMENYYAA